MNTAAKVDQLMAEWKAESIANTLFVVRLANACIGWPYVFGGRGEYCTPSNRRSFYNTKKVDAIKEKCKNFSGSGTCDECKWHPGGTTRFYDCRGFTYWLFLQIGIRISGAGATSQWNDNSNWAEKGPISEMPRDKVCCAFRYDSGTGKMEHTLLYDGDGNYIHDSGEVKKTTIAKYKATHYAIPKGLYGGEQPMPKPEPAVTPEKGTAIVTGKAVALRKGPSTGAAVITRIATGSTVKIATPPSEWEYVEYNGKKGYMMKDYLKEG